MSARCPPARGWRRRSRNSSPIGSAFPPSASASAKAIPKYLASGRGSGGSSALCVGGPAVSFAIDRVLEKGRADRRSCAGGVGGRYRVFRRRVPHRRHRPPLSLAEVATLAADPARLPEGMDAGPRRSRRVPADCGYVPQWLPYLRGRDRSRDRRGERSMRYSAVEDLGLVINPRAGARPDPGRRGSGCGPGAEASRSCMTRERASC